MAAFVWGSFSPQAFYFHGFQGKKHYCLHVSGPPLQHLDLLILRAFKMLPCRETSSKTDVISGRKKKEEKKRPPHFAESQFATFPLKYLLGITVAQAKGVELWEEGWLDSGDLRVELRRPGHGRRSRKQDHSLGSLGKPSRASLSYSLQQSRT